MTPRRMRNLLAFALLLSGLGISICKAQEASGLVKAVQLIGLTGVKENAKGTLKVENGNLHFVRGKANAEVSATSMQDVDVIKKELMAQDAHTTATGEQNGAVPSANSPSKEQKQ